jgi:hypothetical protein
VGNHGQVRLLSFLRYSAKGTISITEDLVRQVIADITTETQSITDDVIDNLLMQEFKPENRWFVPNFQSRHNKEIS